MLFVWAHTLESRDTIVSGRYLLIQVCISSYLLMYLDIYHYLWIYFDRWQYFLVAVGICDPFMGSSCYLLIHVSVPSLFVGIC